MKIKLYITTILLLFVVSISVNAQLDRSKQPKAGPAPKINLTKPQTFELKNGLKIMVVENHKLPRVSATLILDNGPIFESDKAGVSSIFSAMAGNGTSTISKDDFNEEIDFLGASLSMGSQNASFSTLSKYFPRVLELMADAVKNPLLTQEEFEKQQQQLIEGIKAGENSVDDIAGRVQSALAYGKNHPNGEFVTETSAKNVTLEDVKQFYASYFKPNNGYLVFIGDVSFKQVKKLVKKHFKNWAVGNIPENAIPEVKNVAKTEINFVDMPNAVQSNIAVINAVHLKMGHPDYFATRLANKIFGGGAEGRLFQNLREDKGYTYGAYSGFGSNERTAALFRSSAKVRNMVTDSSVVEFVNEMKLFRETKVSEKELKDAKAAYVGNFVMALESPATAANYALNIVTKKLPENFYETYLQKINAVTVDDIQRVANTYFKPENARIVIVGKALDVLPNLEKLPIPILYFDKEANPTTKPEMTRPIPEGVTVKTVIDNYLNAIGGEKIKEISTTFSVAEAAVQGITLTMSSKSMKPNKHVVIVSGMGQVFSKTAFNGKTGYIEQQGNRTEMDEKQLKKSNENVVPFPEIGFANDPEVSLSHIELINGRDAYVLKKGDDTTIFYDVKSGFKIRQDATVEAGGQTIEQTFTFEDFKEVEGIFFPFKMGMSVGPQSFDFIVKEIRLNKDVVESDFE